MSETAEARLAALGIVLPSPAAPAANYVPAVRTGNHLYISGQLPLDSEGLRYRGTCGADVDVDEARAAAHLCAVNVLAQAKASLGDLEKIVRVVKIVGFVASTPDFGDQPKVVNGASDLLVSALGDRGRHARSAVGVAALPFGAPVEVEAVLEVA